jgi:hypothetical protein
MFILLKGINIIVQQKQLEPMAKWQKRKKYFEKL